MAAKPPRVKYACDECGYESPRWLGRCPSCGSWNSMREVQAAPVSPRGGLAPGRRSAAGQPAPEPVRLSQVDPTDDARFPTGVGEFDRVLGGGLVPGSVVLVGGDPGVGKSTLLLQAGDHFARAHGDVLYVSAEESLRQVALRARRLGLDDTPLRLIAETDVDAAVDAALHVRPKLMIVDSIQAVSTADADSVPGSLVQVRECAARLIRLAKLEGIAVLMVGHVTKQGSLAGPKVLEHAVDAVLYLEGERDTQFRVMRAVKNRFGSTDEIGIFEMGDAGLRDVANPSALFLQERAAGEPGTVVVAGVEGSRSLLVEVQALVGPAPFGGTPRRQVSGVDYQRAAIVLAVLERRCGMPLHTHDVYINAVGGVRLDEPAADLAVALAVASAFRDRPVDAGTVVFGEVGLTGEVRGVRQAERRAREAAKLGFRRCILPRSNVPPGAAAADIQFFGVSTVVDALRAVEAGSA
ncbi:MAG: DNA repair protein RadA [Bacillota bacterium]|nr:MAG: DNA repair protein RadA [Bacillota bacterium]